MYKCLKCKSLFDEPKRVVRHNGAYSEPALRYTTYDNTCPHCGGGDIYEVVECPICGRIEAAEDMDLYAGRCYTCFIDAYAEDTALRYIAEHSDKDKNYVLLYIYGVDSYESGLHNDMLLRALRRDYKENCSLLSNGCGNSDFELAVKDYCLEDTKAFADWCEQVGVFDDV